MIYASFDFLRHKDGILSYSIVKAIKYKGLLVCKKILFTSNRSSVYCLRENDCGKTEYDG